MYLEKINGPADVKALNSPERTVLAAEMRTALIQKLSRHGGHCGPNLGLVEATIALHTVFDSPKDRFVFDVSHQTYPHKMLTGRSYGFLDPARYDDITGYSAPQESAHDPFTLGHTSTSVSLAAAWQRHGTPRASTTMWWPLSATALCPAARHWRGWTWPVRWTAT